MHFNVTMEWSNELVLQLLKEYRNKKELWDFTNENYRLASAKFEAWQELATMFDCEIFDVKRKMTSLLASYRRERAKVAQGCPSNWFAMPYMKFLKRPKHREDEEVNNEEDEMEMTEESIVQNYSDLGDNIEILKVDIFDNKKQKTTRSRILKNKPGKRRVFPSASNLSPNSECTSTSGSSQDSKLLEALRNLKKSDRKRDECDIFGEYIANSLRKHDQRTRAMIKHAMNNILFESEMKKYNTNYQHVEINLAEETNPLIIPDQNGVAIQIEESIMETHEDLSGQKLETIDNSYATN